MCVCVCCHLNRDLKIGFGWANSLMVADVSGRNAASVQNAVTLCAKQLLAAAPVEQSGGGVVRHRGE